MDFLDFAKNIEKQGKEQYLTLANSMQEKELSGIFKFMAAEEERHWEVFDGWQKKIHTPETAVELVLGKNSDAFKSIAGHFIGEQYIAPINYEQAYDKALQFENQSIALYESGLSNTTDEEWKPVLTMIIEQEKAHADFLVSLKNFLRHPGEWLENAEWRHAEEY